MSKEGNRNKDRQLGMSHGTAANRLRKMILFKLIQQLGLDICFQCTKPIYKIDNLSVEHKIPWLNSNDPVGLYFDLENIAFSHLSCNISAGVTSNKGNRSKHGTSTRYSQGCRCEKCTKANTEKVRRYRSKNNTL